jgi:hypothetical protein
MGLFQMLGIAPAGVAARRTYDGSPTPPQPGCPGAISTKFHQDVASTPWTARVD